MRSIGQEPPLQLNEALLQEAKQQVLQLYQEETAKRLVFHHYAFAIGLVEEVGWLQEWEAQRGSGEADLLPLQLAALFLPTGRLNDYDNYLEHSSHFATQWLDGKVAPAVRETVVRLINQIGPGQSPTRLEDQLLTDALTIATYLKRPESQSPLLRLEQELMGSLTSKSDWNKWWYTKLLNLPLHTQAAQLQYASVRSELIKEQQKKQNKKEEDLPGTDLDLRRPFDGLESRPPRRAAQTYFRVNYRNHINLSSIADNKANIMISVNSILISILFTFLTYGNVTQVRPVILFPAVIFILTGAVSLIFAIFSARPKVTKVLEQHGTFEERQRNIMFFGSFVHMDLDQYEEALDSVLHDGQLLYGNMARDLYFLGKVLDKKYRYLALSYNIFMAGLVISIISFLMVLF